MREAMKQMKEQSAQMALKAHQDAEAAAAEREAADSELSKTREALEAEQNKVMSVEVRLLLIPLTVSPHSDLDPWPGL